MKLSKRGEFQIIEYLKGQGRTAPGLIFGIGDDCSIASIPEGEVLLTTADLLAEGIHFNLDWTDPFNLGRKAVSVNVSDLAAMGANPRFIFLSLAIPDTLDIDHLDRFLAGFQKACDDYGVVLAGGDTCRSPNGLTISISAQGTAVKDASVMRKGASAGDSLFVTGSLGDSALALKYLVAGERPEPYLLARHINPTARIAVGSALAEANIVTAMIDISDGLLGDLEHILVASGVGAVVEQAEIPLSKVFHMELSNNPDLMELALCGGEDYELLFTARKGAENEISRIAQAAGVPITRIGSIDGNAGELRLLGPCREMALPPQRGYKHFPDTP